jgi:hypothetical protein
MREGGLALPAQHATKYHITVFVISIAKRFMANGKRKSEMGRLSFSLVKQADKWGQILISDQCILNCFISNRYIGRQMV